MSLKKELVIVLLVKVCFLILLKQLFFTAPLITNDREALGTQLLDSSPKN